MTTTKSKSIDLGSLQDAFTKAKRQHELDAKGLAKAQSAHERSKRAFNEATESLKSAAMTVLA